MILFIENRKLQKIKKKKTNYDFDKVNVWVNILHFVII